VIDDLNRSEIAWSDYVWIAGATSSAPSETVPPAPRVLAPAAHSCKTAFAGVAIKVSKKISPMTQKELVASLRFRPTKSLGLAEDFLMFFRSKPA
jgi:hypothetical protein